MRARICGFILGVVLINASQAQVPTQEQCQQADAQLNQVYQQLRGALNNARKEELKQEQRAWIKERDTLIRDNPNNPGGAFKYATEKRTKYLKNKLENLQENSLERTDDSKVTVVPQNFPTDQGFAKCENQDLLIVGCNTPNWTSYALIFDKRSNLLLKKTGSSLNRVG